MRAIRRFVQLVGVNFREPRVRQLPPIPPDLSRGYWLVAVALIMSPAILLAVAAIIHALR